MTQWVKYLAAAVLGHYCGRVLTSGPVTSTCHRCSQKKTKKTKKTKKKTKPPTKKPTLTCLHSFQVSLHKLLINYKRKTGNYLLGKRQHLNQVTKINIINKKVNKVHLSTNITP